MERNTKRHGLVNLLALFGAWVAGHLAARYGGSYAGQVAATFMGLGALVAAVSWFQMRLEARERLEKLEFDELRKSPTGSALFTRGESELFPAQRSREQFERWFVPVFTVLLCLLQAARGFVLWRSLAKELPGPMPQAMVTGVFFLMLFAGLFMFGKFSTTIARLDNLRLLRPAAGYMLFSAYLCGLVLVGIGVVEFADLPKADLIVARVLSVVLMLIALETLVNLVLEIYRPRVKGKVEHPIYESRLVSLLGQPEGVVTTTLQTLDYQFGFKVSETWFAKFIARAATWLVWLQVGVLVVSTSVVFIEPGQQALLERFGSPVSGREVLGPGGHLKLPWPVDIVYRYPTEQIQSFNIGFVPDPKLPQANTVLWTVSHTKEENFLVANRVTSAAESPTNNPDAAEGKRTPPASLLTVSVPVQYQITNLTSWAYSNSAPATLLEQIATREVVRYFAGADFQEVMSTGRGAAAGVLRDRIQAEADRHGLGAGIVFVGLQDIHPPVKVAPDYEKVVAVIHTKEATILAARAEAIKTNLLAEAQAFKTVREAQAEAKQRQVDAQAKAALFTNQVPAFLASPSVYGERAYLQTFARSVANARKYIVLTTNTHDVLMFDLQDKIRDDLLEKLYVPPPKPAPASK